MTDIMIKSFLTVCRTKSITKAAALCNLTQQAVSKHIARLESDLGVDLFFRDSKTMVMSPAGYKYFDLFATISREYEELRRSVGELILSSQRLLRVSYLERLLLPQSFQQAVQSLKSKNPNFGIRCMILDESEVEEALFSGECDLFVGYNIFRHRNQSPTVKQRTFFSDPISYAVSVNNKSGRVARDLSDLSGEPFFFQAHQRFLKYSKEESAERMLAQCRMDGYNPREIIMCDHYSDSKLCVMMGEGVFLTSSFDGICSDPKIRLFPSSIRSPVNCAYISDDISPVLEPLFAELSNI